MYRNRGLPQESFNFSSTILRVRKYPIRFAFFFLLYFYHDNVLPKRFGIHRSSYLSPKAPHLEQFVSSLFYCNYSRYIMYAFSGFSTDIHIFRVKRRLFRSNAILAWPFFHNCFLFTSFIHFTNIFQSFTRSTLSPLFLKSTLLSP